MCYQIRHLQRSRGVLTEGGFDIYSADGYCLFEIFWNRPEFSLDFIFQLIKKWAEQHSLEVKLLASNAGLCFEMYPGTIGVDQALRDMAKLLDTVSELRRIAKGRLVFS